MSYSFSSRVVKVFVGRSTHCVVGVRVFLAIAVIPRLVVVVCVRDLVCSSLVVVVGGLLSC